jgi:hypothetical protein
MVLQIGIGAALIVLTILIHAVAMRSAFRVRGWAHSEGWNMPSAGKITFLTAAFVLLMFMAAMLEALAWAWTYVAVGAFEGLEPAFYFSLVAFTTVGFGDVVLDPSWRVLSAIEAANGVMVFGWTTALIFWFVQRQVQSTRNADRMSGGDEQ